MTYKEALSTAADLLRDGSHEEYKRGVIELLADLYSERGTYMADRKITIEGDLHKLLTQTEPQFKPGDRVFSHYTMSWGMVRSISHTVRDAVHGVTGSPLPDTTWYNIITDDGERELLDDAHGNWEMARIMPEHIAKQYGYGTDPNPRAALNWTNKA